MKLSWLKFPPTLSSADLLARENTETALDVIQDQRTRSGSYFNPGKGFKPAPPADQIYRGLGDSRIFGTFTTRVSYVFHQEIKRENIPYWGVEDAPILAVVALAVAPNNRTKISGAAYPTATA